MLGELIATVSQSNVAQLVKSCLRVAVLFHCYQLRTQCFILQLSEGHLQVFLTVWSSYRHSTIVQFLSVLPCVMQFVSWLTLNSDVPCRT